MAPFELRRLRAYLTGPQPQDMAPRARLVTARTPAAPVERRIALDGVPSYSRLVVWGRSARAAKEVLLQAVLADGDGEPLAIHRVTGFRVGEPFRPSS